MGSQREPLDLIGEINGQGQTIHQIAASRSIGDRTVELREPRVYPLKTPIQLRYNTTSTPSNLPIGLRSLGPFLRSLALLSIISARKVDGQYLQACIGTRTPTSLLLEIVYHRASSFIHFIIISTDEPPRAGQEAHPDTRPPPPAHSEISLP